MSSLLSSSLSPTRPPTAVGVEEAEGGFEQLLLCGPTEEPLPDHQLRPVLPLGPPPPSNPPIQAVVDNDWPSLERLLRAMKESFDVSVGVDEVPRSVDVASLVGLLPAPLLTFAVALQREDVAIGLLQSGAKVSLAAADGSLPLHVVCRLGSVRLVHSLLQRRADVTARNAVGFTAFHEAASGGSVEVLRALMGSPLYIAIALSDANNSVSRTPFFLACDHGHRAVAELLIKADPLSRTATT